MINDKYRFIFMHVPKVAGTSMEDALLNVEGTERPSWYHLRRERIIARKLRDNLDYHFFMFVRNPWDRVVSTYRHSMRNRINRHKIDKPKPLPDRVRFVSFREYVIALHRKFFLGKPAECLTEFDHHHTRRQTIYVPNPDKKYFRVRLKGEVENIFIGRFEQLNEDFNYITNLIGLGNLELPQRDWGSEGKVDYKEWYVDETREIVAETYKKDIEMFGYEFGE